MGCDQPRARQRLNRQLWWLLLRQVRLDCHRSNAACAQQGAEGRRGAGLSSPLMTACCFANGPYLQRLMPPSVQQEQRLDVGARLGGLDALRQLQGLGDAGDLDPVSLAGAHVGLKLGALQGAVAQHDLSSTITGACVPTTAGMYASASVPPLRPVRFGCRHNRFCTLRGHANELIMTVNCKQAALPLANIQLLSMAFPWVLAMLR